MDIITLKQFFMWCTVINFALLLFSSVILMLLKGTVYRIHSKFFNISREVFDTVIYCFIGFYKIVWFVFNVIPWVALLIIS